MPVTTHKNDWVKAARQAMRAEMHSGAAWYISESRGSVKLEVLHEGKKQSRILEYEWDKKGLFNAARRIIEIYKNFYSDTGKFSLAKSCEVVNTASSKSDINLDETIKDFREFLPTVSKTTWEKSYKPVLTKTKELLTSKKKPIDGEDLMLKALKQWEQGSRSRQIARRALQKFLDYAVLRGKLSNIYAPVRITETLKKKRIGYALTDSQILELIASETDKKWQFAYQLLAVYGLRPEELRHLRIVEGVNGKELHSIYQKSMGGLRGDKTKPRKLQPLFVKDADRNPIDWKLQERLEILEELPPLGSDGQGGLALLTHIKRRKLYQQIKEEASKIGQEAVPYSFRHRYAKESHASGFPIANIAQAMGHTPEVHLQNYSRFAPDKTTDLYAQANKISA